MGAAIATVICKMAEQGKFDHLCDDVNRWVGKTKYKIKEGIDRGMSKAEYYGERARYKADQFKDNVENFADDVREKMHEENQC